MQNTSRLDSRRFCCCVIVTVLAIAGLTGVPGAGAQITGPTLRVADEVAPGVKLTSDALVWLVDAQSEGKQTLPLTHRDAVIVNNVGSNIARSTLWMKQKKAVVIPGERATIRVRNGETVLYLQHTEAEDREAAKSGVADRGYAIVRLEPAGTQRMVGHFEFSRFKGVAEFRQNLIETKLSRVPNTIWLRATPAMPLPPGEYGLVKLLPRTDVYSTWVFDFGVDGNPAK